MPVSNSANPRDTAASQYANSSSGPQSINAGAGSQGINNISGGTHNVQIVTQHFFSTVQPVPDQLHTQFREALFLTDPTLDRLELMERKGERAPGTCGWIKKDPLYFNWLDEASETLLWIWGGHGKGKTMLAVFFSRESENITRGGNKIKTTFYFCTAEKRNSASGVLRGLLWHITGMHPEITRYLRTVFNLDNPKQFEAALSSRETLWIMFTRALQQIKVTTFCVLDGLDECDEDSRLFLAEKLFTLADNNATRLFKVVVVSRYQAVLNATACQVKLDVDRREQVALDVKIYVHDKVQLLSQRVALDRNTRKEIETKLSERAEGQFLWVSFVMIKLSQTSVVKETLAALDLFPKGLNPVYERMIEEIEPSDREVSLQILGWLAFVCRPLSLLELEFAVEHYLLPATQAYDRMVGLLLDNGPKVSFQTAHKLLLPDALDLPTLAAINGHKAVIEILLCHGIDPEFIDDRGKSLLHLAAYHGHIAMVRLLLDRDVNVESMTSGPPVPGALSVMSGMARMSWDNPVLAATLTTAFASGIGHASALTHDEEGERALHLAAKAGHGRIVNMLLQEGADVKAMSRVGSTALHFAAAHGHTEVLRTLLEKGADASARNLPGRTALQLALEGRHEACVELMLRKEADSN